ncbi:MAG: AI-2E family transporter [Bauldia sp.]|nr:AI-2E family transporter [Bauldia sp.]
MAKRPPTSWQATREDLLPYVRRLVVTIIILGFALLLWELKDVVLLAFAAVLVAVALLSVTGLVERATRLPHRVALTVGGAILFLGIGGIAWASWPAFQEQLANLVTQLTQSLDEMQTVFGITLPSNAQEIAQALSAFVDRIWSGVLSIAGALVTIVTTLILVVFAGIYLAVDPRTYRSGLTLLFPRNWHPAVEKALDETGRGLTLWLRAQLMTMLVVGTLVGLGTWAIGLPSPLALGLIAGLTEFVPIIGPFAGAVPAVLVAFGIDGATLAWTVVLYVLVQQAEANLITPLLQRRIVSIPPVVLLFSFVALGVIFGATGILVAAPLTIALYILVREFYVGQLLSEQDELGRSVLDDPGEPDEAGPPVPPPRRRAGPDGQRSAGLVGDAGRGLAPGTAEIGREAESPHPDPPHKGPQGEGERGPRPVPSFTRSSAGPNTG